MDKYKYCIVFSNDENRAKEKLDEIASEGDCAERKYGRGFASCFVGDEEWVWVRPLESSKGRRAYKAWVDEKCTIEQFNKIIEPICFGCCEEIRFF